MMKIKNQAKDLEKIKKEAYKKFLLREKKLSLEIKKLDQLGIKLYADAQVIAIKARKQAEKLMAKAERVFDKADKLKSKFDKELKEIK